MKKYFVYVLAVILLYPAAAGYAQTPETALQHYLGNGDTCFHWEVKETYETGTVKVYGLLLTSQQWRGLTWRHQLTVFVPKEVTADGALLFIAGGGVKEGYPNWTGQGDAFSNGMAAMADKNKAIVALLKQTPNQPSFNNLKEDALISYTLHQFKEDGDYTWPLLFPMVKSAVRSMDALQAFAGDSLHHPLRRFVVSGASKRGWTTWLTGASDKRVAAIAPMVIDILNMPVNLDYQMKVWKEYSPQIEDYVNLEIPQSVHSDKGTAITTMVDPYSYRRQLTMPKMIFMGTNDEYWTVDAIKNYYDSIPGQNLIHYVPNAGHNLGDGKSAMEALSAFFGLTVADKPYPVCQWNAKASKKEVTIQVKATNAVLQEVVLWQADSENMLFTKQKWESSKVAKKDAANQSVTVAYPATGFRAFYVDLVYADPNGGTYTESTRMFVLDQKTVLLH
ncbi:PhoPQ-activated pathogenicity-related protein [Filimonas lacunae]|uniref:PhoPQ-activated pathogenicity-related protein n=1 Tax=Filimonas lacunae TaxID=477680 RepID=A0A173MGU0_9BACT|nr:PhoPQ-activated protein PqaA family protein [Filimonas lacunae]BAV06842.1 PhoP/Q-regulated protein PqaA [Filimonas lacunae]SIS98989.1 PhoPQ-activated pathogenicity-related protein [Filimonas lacunae]